MYNKLASLRVVLPLVVTQLFHSATVLFVKTCLRSGVMAVVNSSSVSCSSISGEGLGAHVGLYKGCRVIVRRSRRWRFRCQPVVQHSTRAEFQDKVVES